MKKQLEELLEKCLKSYIKIKNDTKFKDMANDTTVIIHMSRKLDPESTWRKKEQRSVDIFFKTCDKEIFNFNPQPQNSNTQLTSTTTTRAVASEGGVPV